MQSAFFKYVGGGGRAVGEWQCVGERGGGGVKACHSGAAGSEVGKREN